MTTTTGSTDEAARFHRLRSVSFMGGFLDGTQIDFSDGLTCLIGARGTGKTTAMEFVRYALDAFPEEEYFPGARAKFLTLVTDNLGNGEIRLTIETKDGVPYIVSRTATGPPIVMNADESPSEVSLSSGGVFKADIYSQNQIESIADSPRCQLDLIDGFVAQEIERVEANIRQIEATLASSARNIMEARRALDGIGDELSTLPGIEDKLKAMSGGIGPEAELINTAHKLHSMRDREVRAVGLGETTLWEYAESLNSLVGQVGQRTAGAFAADILGGPNEDILRAIQAELNACETDLDQMIQNARERISLAHERIAGQKTNLEASHKAQELGFRSLIAKQKEAQGQENERIGLEGLRNELLAKKRLRDERQASLKTLQNERTELLRQLSVLRDERFSQRKAVADRITEKLAPRIQVRLEQFGDLSLYKELVREALVGKGINRNVVAEKLADSLSPTELSGIVANSNTNMLMDRGGLNANQATNVVVALSDRNMLFRLETVELSDRPEIELLDGETHKSLSSLSTGQKCTAILPILLLDSKNPLLVDQPEDNLDNRFIFDTVVASIQKVRGSRQMIFVTHNPNIPVLGDAEKVVVLKSDGMNATKQKEGTVDDCKNEIVMLLEGGEEAFKRRKERYNY